MSAVRFSGIAGAAGVLALAVGCGGGQTRLNLFSTDWTDDNGATIERVWQRIGSRPIPASADVVVGVAGNDDKLLGLDLASGEKWTFAHPLDARPIVAGSVVVASGGGEVLALDAASGKVIWRRPTGGLALLGAGDDGKVTVTTFRRAGDTGSVLLAVAHDGQIVRQIETQRALGAPAVVAGLAFVPWAGQYVSVIDLDNGNETARVTLRQETSRAWTESGALWFGGIGFVRFDERIGDASKGKASIVDVPARELPGMPKLIPAGTQPLPAPANAEDKTREYAKPESGDQASLADGRWYGTYFRFAMGFDADHGRLAWVNLHRADYIGGAAAEGGLVLCDDQGRVTELDATHGATLSEADLGEPLQACVVNIDGQHASGTPTDAKSLAAQLEEAVRADDPQLVIAQKLLLRELATVDDDSATKTLVDVTSDPRTSPDLLKDARNALANRRNGAIFMEQALARHYDFLKDVLRTPPVGPIAQALGAMREKNGAPLLASHLLDPADTEDDVKQAAAALAVLAGPAELPQLREFFGMYRANAEGDDMSAAVLSVGQAIIATGDKTARAQIEAAATDPNTVPYARDRLGALLTASAEKPKDAGVKKAPPGSMQGTSPAPNDGPKAPAPASSSAHPGAK
ncbi:MAG TPA: PQQ-binding-like beta-propeller repeat protein [Polyangiaceae bacterium]|nr:PQQ-binding-like beta-propeller repeat protein [Polyangiaceae bacterium]